MTPSPLSPAWSVDAALARAAALGIVEPGLARRVALVARLAAPSEGVAVSSTSISGQSLGRQVGASRSAVHKHIEQLRSLGFAIESVPGVGYRLAAPFSDLLAGEAVLPFILRALDAEHPWVVGLPYHYRPTCESTTLVLRGMMHEGTPPSGATVVADHQTRGRGRLDRVWRDEAGRDLMFSVLLRPLLAPGQAHLLSLAAALAVAETVEARLDPGTPVGVKWPNDVVVGGRKLCGILLEGSLDGDRLHWVIAGIGLNVNGDGSQLATLIAREDAGGLAGRPTPVSLRELVGEVPRAPLLAELLGRLHSRWTGLERPGGIAEVLAALRGRDVLAGHPVEVSGGGPQGGAVVGEASGLGTEGQLMVRTPSGEEVAVFAGDASLRGAAAVGGGPRPRDAIVNPSGG